MRMRRSLLSLAALVLVVAGCSDDGGGGGLSAEEQEFADAWSVTLQDVEDGFAVPEEDADCMGAAIMSELGTGPFDDAEVTPDDIGDAEDANSPGELLGDGVISDAQADAILDVWEDDCVDLPQVLGESAATEFELDEEGVTCFVDGLEEGGLARDVLRSSFTSGSDEPPEESLSDLLNLLQSCGQTEGEGGFIVDSIAESFAAGGNLDEEQSQCVAESVVDAIGIDRLTELFSGGGIEDLPPESQQEFTEAVLGAAEECDVPLSALGG